MLEKGNNNPFVCVQNLIKTVKTEVPFSRDKGIDARLIDKPVTEIEGLDADVTELIETYEPRVSADSLSIETDAENGNFTININAAPADIET